MTLSLSPRLRAAASLVRGGGIVADIGTDHGYLPVTLVQEGRVTGAIASDLRPGPLENARAAVNACGLADKVELRLSDGLAAYRKGDADEYVFAGMGGTLIARLVTESILTRDPSLHFVFQPQSRAEELREALYRNGFVIGRELAVREGNRYYVAFDAVWTGQNVPFTAVDCYLGKLPRTPEARAFATRQYDRLKKKYDAAPAGEEKDRLGSVLTALAAFSEGESEQ